jgi:hypothetical protein
MLAHVHSAKSRLLAARAASEPEVVPVRDGPADAGTS